MEIIEVFKDVISQGIDVIKDIFGMLDFIKEGCFLIISFFPPQIITIVTALLGIAFAVISIKVIKTFLAQ